MTLFRWQKGRQKTGYQKMLLATANWPLPFDMYLLKFNEGDEIPPHIDDVGSGEHHRINIVIKKAKRGGDFICDQPIYESSRIKYFRPDITMHSVSKIIKGNRYVFSLGWIKN